MESSRQQQMKTFLHTNNERTLIIFESVCSGIVECLNLVDSDIKQMTKHRNELAIIEQIPGSHSNINLQNCIGLEHSDSQNTYESTSNSSVDPSTVGRSSLGRCSIATTSSKTAQISNKPIIDDINKQIRLAMQYSKQLEAHLLRIEELRSRYEMHIKMALVTNRGSVPGQSNKTTKKAFMENIERLESEFESNIGSFLLFVEDIQGFARICQGDTFEISFKYGDARKFKTRIHVLKSNTQRCDQRQAVFKARITDRLAIKAYECKGPLGKRVLLGHKLCETRDLFKARSQLMTINLNQIGSIKLNLIITWNPLHLAPSNSATGVDISHISLAQAPVYS